MVPLLKIEWLKIRKYRAFLLLFGFFAASIFGLNYIVHTAVSLKLQASPEEGAPAADMAAMLVGEPFLFPDVWQTVAYLSSFLLFIPGLLMILLMGNEFTFRTHRQNIIDGVSRSQFLWAKTGLVFLFGIVVSLLVFLAGCLFGSGPFSLYNIQYVLYFFIQAVAYMSVALLMILLFRRSGVTIGLYFLYVFIVENLLATLISRRIVDNVGAYLPLESADKLIPAPSILGTVVNPEPVDPASYLIVSILWIVVLLWFCHYRFCKMDL